MHKPRSKVMNVGTLTDKAETISTKRSKLPTKATFWSQTQSFGV